MLENCALTICGAVPGWFVSRATNDFHVLEPLSSSIDLEEIIELHPPI